MKQRFLLTMGMMTAFSVFAGDYSEALAFARQKSGEGKRVFESFNLAELPDFSQSPKEEKLKPGAQGELETKGKRFVEADQQAGALYETAKLNKEKPLDKDVINQAKNDYEKAEKQKETAPCGDGSCLPVNNEESNDFAEGAVELGALDSVAEEVKEGQLQKEIPGIFKAQNITCRTVYKSNRINFCRKDKDVLSASKQEKALHLAQREGRAVVVYNGNTYCSKKKKILGKKTCVEKRQSWCVFQSKLARIIQVEARRQLGFSFGAVWGDVNAADCRGLSPSQISLIEFDSPQMQEALKEVVNDYSAGVKPLNVGKALNKSTDYIEYHRSNEDE